MPTFLNWPAKLKPRVVNESLHMVDIMPTALALAGAKANPSDKPLDGKDIWATVTEGKPSPHEDILVNVEAFRGAIIKDKWKLVKIALLPGKTELFDFVGRSGREERRRGSEPGSRPRSGKSSVGLCQTAEDERMAQGAAGLSGRPGADRI